MFIMNNFEFYVETRKVLGENCNKIYEDLKEMTAHTSQLFTDMQLSQMKEVLKRVVNLQVICIAYNVLKLWLRMIGIFL